MVEGMAPRSKRHWSKATARSSSHYCSARVPTLMRKVDASGSSTYLQIENLILDSPTLRTKISPYRPNQIPLRSRGLGTRTPLQYPPHFHLQVYQIQRKPWL